VLRTDEVNRAREKHTKHVTSSINESNRGIFLLVARCITSGQTEDNSSENVQRFWRSQQPWPGHVVTRYYRELQNNHRGKCAPPCASGEEYPRKSPAQNLLLLQYKRPRGSSHVHARKHSIPTTKVRGYQITLRASVLRCYHDCVLVIRDEGKPAGNLPSRSSAWSRVHRNSTRDLNV